MQCNVSRNEEGRLAALHKSNILDTGPEQSFDRLTRLARLALQVPIVLISLVDRDRQWFKSRQGIDASETPRSVSFCAHAIQQAEPFIISDATLNPLFCDNPLVVGEPFIRFYMGIPLKMRDGFVIGTLCVIDHHPRVLSTEEIDVLQDLARMVVSEIELRQIATTDSLTGCLTRRGFDIEMTREFKRSKRSRHDCSIVAIDIDHFKLVNDKYGHASGDLVLQSVVSTIQQELRAGDFVGRLGGEEFAIVLPETPIAGAITVAERIRRAIAGTAVPMRAGDIRVTASFGISCLDPLNETWSATLAKADQALYEAKRMGRNMCVCSADAARDTAAA